MNVSSEEVKIKILTKEYSVQDLLGRSIPADSTSKDNNIISSNITSDWYEDYDILRADEAFDVFGNMANNFVDILNEAGWINDDSCDIEINYKEKTMMISIYVDDPYYFFDVICESMVKNIMRLYPDIEMSLIDRQEYTYGIIDYEINVKNKKAEIICPKDEYDEYCTPEYIVDLFGEKFGIQVDENSYALACIKNAIDNFEKSNDMLNAVKFSFDQNLLNEVVNNYEDDIDIENYYGLPLSDDRIPADLPDELWNTIKLVQIPRRHITLNYNK